MKVDVINTGDGSSTVHNQELDECYHSTFGAITESQHVFIKNGLEPVKKDLISIFEVGLGTGLNALLAFIYASNRQIKINYSGIEKYPLNSTTVENLNYGKKLGFQDIFEQIHLAGWNNSKDISAFFNLTKINQDLLEFNFKSIGNQDIIFFDAFSPTKQPELWQAEIFKAFYHILNTDGILVTYSAAGMVKNALREAGFLVKRLKGPPGKHHMLLAMKNAVS